MNNRAEEVCRCMGLRNRVGKSIFLYSRAGHPSASADKFHLGARVHKNNIIPTQNDVILPLTLKLHSYM